jgi:predicted sugar kinase
VLTIPRGERGLAGDDERRAFDALPPVPPEVTAELCREALLHLLPAAGEGRFDEMSDSLYRFGRLAGSCFAARQGGAFANATVAELVQALRDHGIRGVAQSSWGPTIAALVADEEQAAMLVEWLHERAGDEAQIVTAAPSNRGAQIVVET